MACTERKRTVRVGHVACSWTGGAECGAKSLLWRRARAEEAAEAGAQVDNMAAGGFFGRFGREGNAPVRPMVTPYVVGQTPTHTLIGRAAEVL